MTRQASVPRWVSAGIAVSLAVTVIAAVFLLLLSADRTSATDLPDLATMPAFKLTDQANQPVTTADVTGKILLVSFIYTSCPDICPMLTAQMKALQEDLRDEGLLGEAQLLSISVDPEVDTPDVLRDYAAGYGADPSTWRFLTGEPDHVRKVVVEGFLLGVQRTPASNVHAGHGTQGSTPDYRIDHSGRIALVDQSGRIRAYYEGTELDRARVIADVRSLAGR